MPEEGYGLSENFQRKQSTEQPEFRELWPSDTSGDGKLRKNNIRDGSAQGKGSFVLKVSCRQCGFMVDMNKVDHSGGSLDGNGGGGAITTATTSWTTSGGAAASEKYGSQAYNLNAGCPLCFSKNSTPIRRNISAGNPWDRVSNMLGF